MQVLPGFHRLLALGYVAYSVSCLQRYHPVKQLGKQHQSNNCHISSENKLKQ